MIPDVKRFPRSTEQSVSLQNGVLRWGMRTLLLIISRLDMRECQEKEGKNEKCGRILRHEFLLPLGEEGDETTLHPSAASLPPPPPNAQLSITRSLGMQMNAGYGFLIPLPFHNEPAELSFDGKIVIKMVGRRRNVHWGIRRSLPAWNPSLYPSLPLSKKNSWLKLHRASHKSLFPLPFYDFAILHASPEYDGMQKKKSQKRGDWSTGDIQE